MAWTKKGLKLLAFCSVFALLGAGCGLLRELDPDTNVRDGGTLDGSARDDAGAPCSNASGTVCCDAQPLPSERETCAAYWESYRWNGSACEKIGYSGCGPNEAYFESAQACEQAYAVCDLEPGPCDPQPPVDIGPCDAAFEGFYWDGSGCVRGTSSGCEPAPGLYETEALCQAAHKECADDCHVGGCSGQLCTADPNAVSTCEWRSEYACYRESFARCERQNDGACGWTPRPDLTTCLTNGGPDN